MYAVVHVPQRDLIEKFCDNCPELAFPLYHQCTGTLMLGCRREQCDHGYSTNIQIGGWDADDVFLRVLSNGKEQANVYESKDGS